MNIATDIARKMSAGAVICRESERNGFAFLSEPGGQEAVAAKLDEFALRIVMTSSHTGFFAAEADPEAAARHLRISAEQLCREAQRIEEVQSFLLDVFPDGNLFRSGYQIAASELLDAVNRSNALIEKLTQLTTSLNMTSVTTARRVSNLLANLCRDGYLVCINAKTEHYVATARVDRAWDVTEHLASKRPGVAEAVEAATQDDKGQGDLFQ